MARIGNALWLIVMLVLKCDAAAIPVEESGPVAAWNDLVYESKAIPRDLIDDPFLKISESPEPVTIVREGSSVILQCEALGIPPPVITWRKDGKGVTQTDSDNESNVMEKLSNGGSRTIESSATIGRLLLDCVDPSMAGLYECVAENGYEMKQNKTRLEVLPGGSHSFECAIDKEEKAVSPTIVMYTEFRFEDEGNNVQLFCRASGYPKPVITWLDSDQNPLKVDENRYMLANGDLFLTNVQSFDQYSCLASNVAGADKVETFIYATKREEF